MRKFFCAHSVIYLTASLTLFFSGVFEPAQATPLSITAFDSLAYKCASTISPETLAAVARTESGLDPLELHDNTTGTSDTPSSLNDARNTAERWVARGDSVDLGLMQINSANLGDLGMTVRSALSPCLSLAGGADILRAAYGNSFIASNQQIALLQALSRYNTGTPLKGILNGYARTVMANLNNQKTNADDPMAKTVTSNSPLVWDIGAVGSYSQSHGAPWLVAFVPPNEDRMPTPAPNGLSVDTIVDASIPKTRRSQ